MTTASRNFWEKAYERNIRKLISLCFRYTRDRQLSEDLAHDAFMKAIDKVSMFKGVGSFDAWLRRIAVNHTLQYIRDERKLDRIDDNASATYSENQESPNDSSSQNFSGLSELELLRAIEQLPEHHRLVFNLYAIDEYSHQQIADLLEISVGTSKSHLARARKKLKAIVKQKVKERDRSAFMILVLSDNYVDRIFKGPLVKSAIDLNIEVSSRLNRDTSLPVIRYASFVSKSMLIAASASTIIMSFVAFYYGTVYTRVIHPPEAVTLEFLEPITQQGADIDSSPIGDTLKNNSPKSDSSTATYKKKSVNVDTNKYITTMKTLHSLSAAMLVSSSLMLDSSAQVSNAATSISNVRRSASQVSIPDNDRPVKSETGTISARSIFWSEKNNNVYLEGRARIDFGRNHFDSDGATSFLGEVYLVIVDGITLELGSKVNLVSDKKYTLSTLSRSKAVAKYGQRGERGAVEIDMIK